MIREINIPKENTAKKTKNKVLSDRSKRKSAKD